MRILATIAMQKFPQHAPLSFARICTIHLQFAHKSKQISEQNLVYIYILISKKSRSDFWILEKNAKNSDFQKLQQKMEAADFKRAETRSKD